MNRLYKLAFVGFLAVAILGCKGGGGGGGSSSGSGTMVYSALTQDGDSPVIIDLDSDPIDGGDEPLGTTHNPEPSSLLLLSSGLIGMAAYAKAKLKSKAKK